jgi:hypothetical protein
LFANPQHKVDLTYLMGLEATKKGVAGYDHNKHMADVGCRHLLMHLAPQVDWATDCLRWYLAQEKLDDLADCLLQALAWYQRQSPRHTLPYNLVPRSAYTVVAPPAIRRAASTAGPLRSPAVAKKTVLQSAAAAAAARFGGGGDGDADDAEGGSCSGGGRGRGVAAPLPPVPKAVLRASRISGLAPAIVMGKRKAKSERKVRVGRLSHSTI